MRTRPCFAVVLGLLSLCSPDAQGAAHLKLKRYFALKIKPWTEGMYLEQGPDRSYFLAGITANTSSDVQSSDWFLAKFSPTGVKLWHRTFNGRGNGRDVPGGLSVDLQGNAVVCGYTAGLPTEGSSAALVKWDPNGLRKWVRYSPGQAAFSEEIDDYLDLKTDYLGNVVAVGSKSMGSSMGVDLLVEKVSPTGALLWSRTWDGGMGASATERGTHVELGPTGNVYVGGQAPTSTLYGGGFWIYSPAGVPIKFIRLGASAVSGGNLTSLRFQGGRPYVFGTYYDTYNNLFSNVYSSTGAPVYLRGTPGNAAVRRNSVMGDAAPDGSFLNFAQANTIAGSDYFGQVQLYNPSGIPQGLATIDLPTPVYPRAVFAVSSSVSYVSYRSFVGGIDKLFLAPVVAGKLQSGSVNLLNLAGQLYEPPVKLATGEIGLPYTQNGAAGARIFEMKDWGASGPSSTPKGKGFDVALSAQILGSTRYFRVRIFVDGLRTPLYDNVHDLNSEDWQVDLAIPDSVVKNTRPGDTLTVIVEEVDVGGGPKGGATSFKIAVVP